MFLRFTHWAKELLFSVLNWILTQSVVFWNIHKKYYKVWYFEIYTKNTTKCGILKYSPQVPQIPQSVVFWNIHQKYHKYQKVWYFEIYTKNTTNTTNRMERKRYDKFLQIESKLFFFKFFQFPLRVLFCLVNCEILYYIAIYQSRVDS